MADGWRLLLLLSSIPLSGLGHFYGCCAPVNAPVYD
jgi:hypothetical protein